MREADIAGFLLLSALGVLALHEIVLRAERTAPVGPREVLLSEGSTKIGSPSTED